MSIELDSAEPSDDLAPWTEQSPISQMSRCPAGFLTYGRVIVAIARRDSK